MPTVLDSDGSSVLFNIDTGWIVEPPSALMLCFPNLPSCVTISYKHMDASTQIIRLMRLPDDFEFSHLTGIQYEAIERWGNWGHGGGSDGTTMFISIVNSQTSHCDNYLFPGWSELSCDIVQYAQGFFIVDKVLGSTLKIEPGTAGHKKWITLDNRVNTSCHGFTLMEDGSRLLGWIVVTDLILLREWETSTGILRSDRIHGRL
ncbi:hypothetical protein ARMSODRAFT_776023 [Armillaria solidipes]|uniref:Uncharacterized protein n=1 Tax=Armillaria solidipes TaxID=1076256 RepID=A0A2H3AL03_9AGAR|nr:hypothetical protein ARMSODRAFT_776023 [Armillaria solidipes]